MKSPLCLSQAIERYLQYRSALGFGLLTEGRTLRGLGRYARRVGHTGPLTTELALQWIQLPLLTDRLWWARRLEMVRRFAQFWKALEPRTEVPPPGLFGPAYRRSAVHIYTPIQIEALLRATGFLGSAEPLRADTFRTLFGLLASTGLRISEALHLRDCDVDWIEATLTVHRSKGGRSRCLPVDPSVLKALQAYQERRRQRHPRTLGESFFVNVRGQPLLRAQAEKTFGSLRTRLGWNQDPLPRLYDLRHTFAVATLLRWYRQGQDVGAKLPALTTYLGHRNLRDTYWYLSAVPELLALGSARWAAILEGGCHD
jgi:integrase